jgi:hypothetical protein
LACARLSVIRSQVSSRMRPVWSIRNPIRPRVGEITSQ